MEKSLDELIAEARRECEAEKLAKKKMRYSDDEVEELVRLVSNLNQIEETR